ncbi:phage tail domain-containing protein [Metabacillus bambusae]|uniref:Phage tail family protein n=1 Tax=Metabacillus bambusae TaxID=2795218 RepID=A0ABS3N5A5_9BACI|nr:phage tail domain-containing protein [Metabacillus bambusae]MBO1513266.1 phage tail family protein [Metabacillus bambusae]
MFQIYNESFNPIALPLDDLGYGLKGLDVEVSSTAQDVTEHTIQGVPGTIVTGFRDSSRDATLNARLKAKDAIDYRLKRDRVFAFFKRLGTFYITEKQQGNKLIKVRVVDSYKFERPVNLQTFATVEIPLKIVGQPYWISRFTSMDLDNNEGVPFNDHWSFGMGLEADLDKLTYVYGNQSSFNIFNAGTVPIKTIQEKDNCIITIEVNQSVTHFKLYDATGRYFEYNPTHEASWSLVSGNKIILNGHYMTMNNTPIMERTNRYFLNLLPGNNAFTVDGLSNYTISFDFRFKYD